MEVAVNTSSCSDRQGEQANYFYVVWPEETVTNLGAVGRFDPTLCAGLQPRPLAATAPLHRRPALHPLQGPEVPVLHHCPPQQQRMSAMDQSPGGVAPQLSPPSEKPLPDIEVGGGAGFASPLTSPILSIANTSPLVTTPGSPAPAFREAGRSSEITTTGNEIITGIKERDIIPRILTHPTSSLTVSQGLHARPLKTNTTTLLTNSPMLHSGEPTTREAVGKMCTKVSSGQGGNGTIFGETFGPPHMDLESYGSCRRKRSRFLYLNGCLECEVKDAEIKTLRRRIQVMEEVVALLNQKMSTVQQPSNSSVLFSPMVMPPVVSQVVVPSSYTTTPTTSIKVHTPGMNVETNHCTTATSSDSDDTSSDSASIAYAQAELCPPAEHRVELLPGTGVYVTLPQLEEARRESKNGTQLARKLMDAFWDRETLARSSLSSKSKYQYQQLDPNVISAIEAYCLNFDANTHSRDLHACMTDKCCQARSRRGAPYKTLQNGLLMHNGVVHNGFNGT